MTEIYLIRHGEAEGNVFRRLHGQYDSLLMPRGYQQRLYLMHRFSSINIDACFSSDLTRACLTAASIYDVKGLTLQTDPRFRELDVGVWEDLTYGWLDKHYTEDMHRFSHDPVAWRVQGSETYEQYTGRFIEGLIDAAKHYDGGTIAVFCHGAVLRGTLMRLFFNDQPDKLPLSDNAGVSRLFYDNGRFSCKYLNDNSHIPPEYSTFHLQAWWRKTDNRKEANLYFMPFSTEDLQKGLILPPASDDGVLMTAWHYSGPVGILSMAAPEEGLGRIHGMTLRDEMLGRYYADQLLGCAISHFRRLGCSRIALDPGKYPDDIHLRYHFEPDTMSRNIDPQKERRSM